MPSTPADAPQPPIPYIARTLRSMPDRRAALLIAGIAAGLALAARLVWPFDGLYGQDAFAYFRYAQALWPWLLHGTPLPIYYWPSGYPLLVALALPLLGGSSAAGQAVSVTAVAAAAGCTFLLSRELLPDPPGGRLAAWVAGLAVAFCGDALRAGLVTMSDALALACCAAAIWALARYRRTWRGRWLAIAAIALAWATITRWVCGLLAVPMALFVLCDLLTTDDRQTTTDKQRPTTGDRRPATGEQPKDDRQAIPPYHPSTNTIGHSSLVIRLWKPIVQGGIACALGALIVIPQLLISQTTPAALSEHQWVVAWNIANIWRRDFVTVDGAQHYQLPVGAYYLARMAWPSLLFPLLALLCLPGALWLARRRFWPVLALLAGWPALLWLFLSGIPFQNARFILPALPALAALAGLGFGWAYSWTTDDRRPTLQDSAIVGRRSSVVGIISPLPIRRWTRVFLLATLALSLVGSLAWGLRDYRNLVAYKNDQLALVGWVRAQVPTGGTLISFGATLTLQHYTNGDVRELFYLAPPDLDAIVQQRQPVYLLLDVGNIESQWAELRPQQDYHYLQQHPGLKIIGQHSSYTLFQVAKPAQ